MKKRNWKRIIINTIISLIIPVGMFLIFAVLSRGRTATVKMFVTTFRQSIIPIIICWGLMLNMSVGMMNFSAGAMMLCAGILGGNLAQMTGTGIPGVLVFCLLVTLVEGAITGFLYNKMRVPCMVLTIGMMMIWESFPKLIFSSGVNLPSSMTLLARSPYCFILLGVMFVVFHMLYNKTAFGHNLRAIGNNQAIANSVGLDSDKIKFASFVFGAVFLGIAATLYVSERGELRNVQFMASMTIMMDGFMGMFLALFLSKYCNMSVAVIIGSFSMKMLSNGFVAIGLSARTRDIMQGLLLLVLLTISANAGVFERIKTNKAFAKSADDEYRKIRQTGKSIQ